MFRLITLEPNDTDECKWHQCVCLIAPNRMICNMTQFDLTWPWPQVKFSNWPFGVKMGIIWIVLTIETQRRQNHRPRPNTSEVMDEKQKHYYLHAIIWIAVGQLNAHRWKVTTNIKQIKYDKHLSTSYEDQVVHHQKARFKESCRICNFTVTRHMTFDRQTFCARCSPVWIAEQIRWQYQPKQYTGWPWLLHWTSMRQHIMVRVIRILTTHKIVLGRPASNDRGEDADGWRSTSSYIQTISLDEGQTGDVKICTPTIWKCFHYLYKIIVHSFVLNMSKHICICFVHLRTKHQ